MKTLRNVLAVVLLITVIALSKTNRYAVVSNDNGNLVVNRKGKLIHLYYPNNNRPVDSIRLFADYNWNWNKIK